MDDIKLFAKYKKELETLIQKIRIYNQDIGMWHAYNEKWKKIIMELQKSKKNQNACRKGKWILEADTIKQRWKEKKMRSSKEWKNSSKAKAF